jgi:hypothetical protein
MLIHLMTPNTTLVEFFAEKHDNCRRSIVQQATAHNYFN